MLAENEIKMSNDSDPYWRLRPPPPTPEDEVCCCADNTPLVLQPHLSSNPISCARCNLEVPPERIGFNATLAEALASWQSFHECFYLLWLDSGEFEQWAAAQLLDPSSTVNTRGLELAVQLSDFRRCYLWWFQDKERCDRMPTAECPRCSSKLEARFKGERPQGATLYVCEHCSIALGV